MSIIAALLPNQDRLRRLQSAIFNGIVLGHATIREWRLCRARERR